MSNQLDGFTEAGALLPPALRYMNWLNVALHQGKCPLNELLLVLGSFYRRVLILGEATYGSAIQIQNQRREARSVR